jgi:hypothetical protein
MNKFFPTGRNGFLPVLFAHTPRVYDFFGYYLMFFLLGYFSLITVGLWLGLGVIEIWVSGWSPLADLFASFIPAFENIHRGVIGTQYADRLPAIRHLLAFGWLTTILVMVFAIVIVFALPEEDWRRLLSRYSRSQLISLVLLLLLGMVPTVFVSGIALPFSDHEFLVRKYLSDPILLFLGLVFFVQAFVSAMLILVVAALALSFRYGDAADVENEPR